MMIEVQLKDMGLLEALAKSAREVKPERKRLDALDDLNGEHQEPRYQGEHIEAIAAQVTNTHRAV